jgi:hypothetical protein
LKPTAESEGVAAVRPLETFNRLLAALALLAEEAERAGGDGIREWAALSGLDAVHLGEQLGDAA